jgi:uncharacterized protein
MKALYITSVQSYSGKTAVCLALGKQLQSKGLRLGYLKPMSTQPWRTPDGRLADEDAAFLQRTLNLTVDPTRLSPVIVTPNTLRQRLAGEGDESLIDLVRQAAVEMGEDQDILLVEGGADLREGYAMGLSNLFVAQELGAPALVLVRYLSEMQIVDASLAAQFRLGDQMLGVILNHIPEDAQDSVQAYARPFLERQGIRVLGSLPLVPRLSALSVGELQTLLKAEVLTRTIEPDALIETFTVGAMTLEAALSRFRRQKNKAVITGGDRTDIQLAALETSTVALVLTGHLHPSPLVIHQAETVGVPVLLVKDTTMETVDAVEGAYGKTRLGQPEKLHTFLDLMAEHVDLTSIYTALGLD